MSKREKHIGYHNTSFPVEGVEASSYEDLGWGLVKECESAWGRTKEEATERLLEKEANSKLNE